MSAKPMLLALRAAPLIGLSEPEPAKAPAEKSDGEILAACMNGQRIGIDEHHVMTCSIARRGR